MSVIPSANITVSCPQCGSTQFIQAGQADSESETFKCSGCGATYVGDELADQFVATDAADSAIEKEASDAIDKLMAQLLR